MLPLISEGQLCTVMQIDRIGLVCVCVSVRATLCTTCVEATYFSDPFTCLIMVNKGDLYHKMAKGPKMPDAGGV